MNLDIEAEENALTAQLLLTLKSSVQSIDTANATIFTFDNYRKIFNIY
jgi:hypothetical protein